MNDFDYLAPTTIDDAVAALHKAGGRGRLLAGGTDLIVQLREHLREAEVVIDVKKIAELLELRFDGAGNLHIGAAAPCYRIYGDAKIAAAFPALVDSARIIGGWQIQSRASVGGNLCNSSPAADSIPSLIALGAVCHVAGPSGKRTLPVTEFCTAPGRNVLATGEMLVSLELPAPGKQASSAYERFIPRNEMDIAVVSVGSALRLSADGKIADARIALGAVAPKPLFADEASKFLVGKAATAESFAQAGELAKKIATPISDMRGPADHRTHLVGVLVQRTLTKAVTRAVA